MLFNRLKSTRLLQPSTWMVAGLVVLSLTACSSLSGLKDNLSESVFGRKLAEPPVPLTEFKPRMTAKVRWSYKLGDTMEYDFSPVVTGDAVYAASAAGDVVRLEAASGKQVWRVSAGEPLSGGIGVAPNLVLVGTAGGYLMAYDQSGKLLWKSKLSSQVLSAPREAEGIIVVRTGDSRIYGINVADGTRKWVYERATPTLSLRSSAGVTIDQGAVFAGFAGGKLIALRLEDGSVVWEVSVALPKGATEIERIADITSLPVVEGGLVYAAAYQGKIAGVDRAAGRVVWSRDISSYTGIDAEDSRVYLSHATGSVYSLDYFSGKTFWRQGSLQNRQLSAPLFMDKAIAVGDIEGYVHFLDYEDGSFVARVRAGDKPVMPQMSRLGDQSVLLQTRGGGLYAVDLQ